MPDIQPPTGDEQPLKSYGTGYLDEIDELKARIAQAPVNGVIDTEGFEAASIAAVAPSLLTDEQIHELDVAKNEDSYGKRAESYTEANGDKDWRVEAGQQSPPVIDPSIQGDGSNEEPDRVSSGSTDYRSDSSSASEGSVTKEETNADPKNEDDLLKTGDQENTHPVSTPENTKTEENASAPSFDLSKDK